MTKTLEHLPKALVDEVERLRPWLVFLCIRARYDKPDAEDIVSEAIISFYQTANKFSSASSLITKLRRALSHRISDDRKYRRRHVNGSISLEQMDDDAISYTPRPDAGVDVIKAMGLLDPITADTIYQYVIVGHSLEDIGTKHNLSHQGVWWKIQQGLRQLRQTLG